MDTKELWRVVVRYDDPRGGTWRGPLESHEDAKARLIVEAARLGDARMERVA